MAREHTSRPTYRHSEGIPLVYRWSNSTPLLRLSVGVSVGVSVCLSVGLFPRHGYSFKDTTVWSSPNDSKCLRLGVSVLKIFNLPIPEVAFKKNVKISLFFATRPCALIFTMNAHSTQLQGLNFFFFYAL